MDEPFFFDQDSSCHWYMVPERIRAEWDKWNELDEDDEAAWEAPEGVVMLGGGISRITVRLAAEATP